MVGQERNTYPIRSWRVSKRISWTLKAVAVLAVAAIGTAFQPNTAEAQARGTLQATATVVDTRPSFDGLRVAQAAVTTWSGSAVAVRDSVQTVAQVSLQPRPEQSRTLVVTVDFLRN